MSSFKRYSVAGRIVSRSYHDCALKGGQAIKDRFQPVVQCSRWEPERLPVAFRLVAQRSLWELAYPAQVSMFVICVYPLGASGSLQVFPSRPL